MGPRKWIVDPSAHSYYKLTTTYFPVCLFKVRLNMVENWKLKLKTEKYCNKIIFKYINSIMKPIFNEKIAKK